MKRRLAVVSVVSAVVALSAQVGFAQVTGAAPDPAMLAREEALASVRADREAVITEIVDQWRSQLRSAVPAENIADEAEMLTAVLRRTSVEKLWAAREAETYEEVLAIVRGRWQGPASGSPLAPGAIPNMIGDTGADLVFTPVTPCRIVDTRFATGGWAGKVGPNSGNWYSVNLADYSAQGGFAGSCGIPTSFNPSGVVLNVTSTGQTGLGNLRVVDCGGGLPTVSLVNYTPGVNLANATATRSALSCGLGPGGDNDIYIHSAVSASDVVVDIMGYFAPPEATALECVTTAANAENVAAGANFGVFPPACPTGYTQVSVGCRAVTYNTANWAIINYYSGGGSCWGTNTTGSAHNYEARGRCCRLPGR
jgi:hypothetical protein